MRMFDGLRIFTFLYLSLTEFASVKGVNGCYSFRWGTEMSATPLCLEAVPPVPPAFLQSILCFKPSQTRPSVPI